MTLGALADGACTATRRRRRTRRATSAWPRRRWSFTVDTAAPLAPTGLADASDVGGYVNAANDTAAQTLTGSAETNSTVKVYLNGAATPAFTTTADGSGAWSVTLGALADGLHSYTATATDAAGNAGVASAALAFTVDTAAPLAPTGLADASDVGGFVNAANDTGGAAADRVGRGQQHGQGLSERRGDAGVHHGGGRDRRVERDAGGAGGRLPQLHGDGDGRGGQHRRGLGGAGRSRWTRRRRWRRRAWRTLPTSAASSTRPTTLAAQQLTGSAEADSTVKVYLQRRGDAGVHDDGGRERRVERDAGGAGGRPAQLRGDGDGRGGQHRRGLDGAGRSRSTRRRRWRRRAWRTLPTSAASSTRPTTRRRQPLTGSAEADSTVKVYLERRGDAGVHHGGGRDRRVERDAGGAGGRLAYSYAATATDAAGNTGVASAALVFTVDTAAPLAPTGLADASDVGGFVNAANDTAAQTADRVGRSRQHGQGLSQRRGDAGVHDGGGRERRVERDAGGAGGRLAQLRGDGDGRGGQHRRGLGGAGRSRSTQRRRWRRRAWRTLPTSAATSTRPTTRRGRR